MTEAATRLYAVTPIDGRYADKVERLDGIVSEYGLIRNRVIIEAAWLGVLGGLDIPGVEKLEDGALTFLSELPSQFTETDALRIKEIEAETNHDVKAVELWLREKLAGDSRFDRYLQLIHFGCTSEDINNLAYAMMMRDARKQVISPELRAIVDDVSSKALAYSGMPLLARTHGQPATPTTIGKEMAVFAKRLRASQIRLGEITILGKFNGASGNYNAASFALPEINWPEVSREFVEGLGFTFNDTTTQIEPHDWQASFFNELAHGNTILIGLARDMWTYISNGIFRQRVKSGETGSSTMPHKVNPIDFENAEANFGLANATLTHLAGKLPISRLQRDLSDSSAQRATGTALGHTLVGYVSVKKGLGKVEPDVTRAYEELSSEWSVLTEAVQTVMRRHGVESAYETIKAASRGRKITEADYRELVISIEIPEYEKRRLLELTPATYLGYAEQLAVDVGTSVY